MKLIILQLGRSKQLLFQAELFDYLPDPEFPDKSTASEKFNYCFGVR
jgi:hypothetical protein